jgi:hypothetical protein
MNLIARCDPVRRADNNSIIGGEAGPDLNFLPEVARDRHWLKDDPVIGSDRCHA